MICPMSYQPKSNLSVGQKHSRSIQDVVACWQQAMTGNVVMNCT